jgi:AraC family transcriptional regulator
MLRSGGFRIDDQREPANRALPWHAHAAPLLSLVMAGQYEEGFGSRILDCTRHDLVVKPAGERHYDRVGRSGARSLLVEVDSTAEQSLTEVVAALREPLVLSTPPVRQLVGCVAVEYRQTDELSALALEALLLEVLVRAARRYRRSRQARGRPSWLRVAEECLRDAVARPPTLSTTAAACGVHPASLAREFRRWHGCSVGEFVRRRRVDVAMQALLHTNLPLADVAHRAGFFDQSHMGRAIRRYAGITPGEIRARRGSARGDALRVDAP